MVNKYCQTKQKKTSKRSTWMIPKSFWRRKRKKPKKRPETDTKIFLKKKKKHHHHQDWNKNTSEGEKQKILVYEKLLFSI